MHNGFLTVDDEKMSKSLNNFFRIRDVLDSGHVRDPEVLRFFLASSHYRGPINYSIAQIDLADTALTRMYLALRGLEPAESYTPSEATRKFEAAMDDDFNTPEATAALQGLVTEINRAKDANDWGKASELAAELKRLGGVLGVLYLQPEEFLRKSRVGALPGMTPQFVGITAVPGLPDEDIQRLIDERTAARAAKNFQESDRIRDELTKAGIILEDKPGVPTTWRRA
jgi:cysteinyl-tRNA synthetase